VVCDGRCVISVGRSVVYDFDVADTGMRNLAVVALTDAGRSVTEVAAVFGVTATYVSMLRGRARQRIERRGLQMVLRLLADNGEAWLAEQLGAYLADPDEYRAILRHLLHLGGRVDYRSGTPPSGLTRPHGCYAEPWPSPAPIDSMGGSRQPLPDPVQETTASL
jgi:hypothetical protein